jgi:hypothetical protein
MLSWFFLFSILFFVFPFLPYLQSLSVLSSCFSQCHILSASHVHSSTFFLCSGLFQELLTVFFSLYLQQKKNKKQTNKQKNLFNHTMEWSCHPFIHIIYWLLSSHYYQISGRNNLRRKDFFEFEGSESKMAMLFSNILFLWSWVMESLARHFCPFSMWQLFTS